MRVFAAELKKLCRPGLLCLLALLGALYFAIVAGQFVGVGTEWTSVPVVNGQLLIERYGPTLEDDEFTDLTGSLLPAMRAQIDAVLAANPLAQQYGATDYDSFRTFLQQAQDKLDASDPVNMTDEIFQPYRDSKMLENQLDESGLLFSRYGALLTFCQDFEAERRYAATVDWSAFDDDFTARRMAEYSQKVLYGPTQAWRGLLPAVVCDYYTLSYAQAGIVWIVLSVLLLVSPAVVRDRLSRVQALQWSGRQGRHILSVQLGAALLAALAWIAVNLGVYAALFWRNGFSAFAAVPMGSFQSGFRFAGDMNYGQWCILLAALALPLGLGTAALGFFVARFSDNYVAMLLKLVPLAVAVGYFALGTLTQTATWFCSHLPLILIFFAAALALCLLDCRHRRRAELAG